MAVEPKPNGKRSIGVGLAEASTPFPIPQVKVEMIDVGHLSPPVHVGVGGFFLTFAWPGFPDRGLLLCPSNEDNPILTFLGRRLQVGESDFFFVLAILK